MRAMVWTVVLLLFLAFEIYLRYPWLSLVIPGTILLWYGILAEDRGEIAMRKRRGSGLN
jgi:hypothetical protein